MAVAYMTFEEDLVEILDMDEQQYEYEWIYDSEDIFVKDSREELMTRLMGSVRIRK